MKQASDKTRYQRPTPPNNYIRDNTRLLNNNNNIGNNRQDRRFIPPLQNRPNDPAQNSTTCNYCKKPRHLVKDWHRFKARVDVGIIIPYAPGPSGNQPIPSRVRGEEPRRSDAVNRPRVQGATKRPMPQPSIVTIKPSYSCARQRMEYLENRRLKEKQVYGKTTIEFRFGRKPLRIIWIKINKTPSIPTARTVSPDLN